MSNSIEILKIYNESFRANKYSNEPFRMIGLIDVSIEYIYGIEKVTLAFFRSSGTNSGKIKGLWYPIVGIKTMTGEFTEFTEYLNFVLTNTTRMGIADEGWLAKSLFFASEYTNESIIRGFSSGIYYESLLKIGKTLRDLYEKDKFQILSTLDAEKLNSILTSKEIYKDNKHTQRENFEKFIQDIFNEVNMMDAENEVESKGIEKT
ncbi:hypothetical protein D2A34_17395 [Clostridium chromiireducens]|uniref:Uncharacterized protein n=1 Tax=Clostridium chromiireducens TaxID=225345 RepID=A0A399IKQ7_9CLOT|nr:hypothetical protein [Clostridium chromiireducens]MVX65352.1 hypothetical protein [Clostridium chromiireducens]RII33511.1 hypothetical protein D2A34_17395 [Clostridium chromiireducens]